MSVAPLLPTTQSTSEKAEQREKAEQHLCHSQQYNLQGFYHPAAVESLLHTTRCESKASSATVRHKPQPQCSKAATANNSWSRRARFAVHKKLQSVKNKDAASCLVHQQSP
jgi:hypothetical protein